MVGLFTASVAVASDVRIALQSSPVQHQLQPMPVNSAGHLDTTSGVQQTLDRFERRATTVNDNSAGGEEGILSGYLVTQSPPTTTTPSPHASRLELANPGPAVSELNALIQPANVNKLMPLHVRRYRASGEKEIVIPGQKIDIPVAYGNYVKGEVISSSVSDIETLQPVTKYNILENDSDLNFQPSSYYNRRDYFQKDKTVSKNQVNSKDISVKAENDKKAAKEENSLFIKIGDSSNSEMPNPLLPTDLTKIYKMASKLPVLRITRQGSNNLLKQNVPNIKSEAPEVVKLQKQEIKSAEFKVDDPVSNVVSDTPRKSNEIFWSHIINQPNSYIKQNDLKNSELNNNTEETTPNNSQISTEHGELSEQSSYTSIFSNPENNGKNVQELGLDNSLSKSSLHDTSHTNIVHPDPITSAIKGFVNPDNLLNNDSTFHKLVSTNSKSLVYKLEPITLVKSVPTTELSNDEFKPSVSPLPLVNRNQTPKPEKVAIDEPVEHSDIDSYSTGYYSAQTGGTDLESAPIRTRSVNTQFNVQYSIPTHTIPNVGSQIENKDPQKRKTAETQHLNGNYKYAENTPLRIESTHPPMFTKINFADITPSDYDQLSSAVKRENENILSPPPPPSNPAESSTALNYAQGTPHQFLPNDDKQNEHNDEKQFLSKTQEFNANSAAKKLQSLLENKEQGIKVITKQDLLQILPNFNAAEVSNHEQRSPPPITKPGGNLRENFLNTLNQRITIVTKDQLTSMLNANALPAVKESSIPQPPQIEHEPKEKKESPIIQKLELDSTQSNFGAIRETTIFEGNNKNVKEHKAEKQRQQKVTQSNNPPSPIRTSLFADNQGSFKPSAGNTNTQRIKVINQEQLNSLLQKNPLTAHNLPSNSQQILFSSSHTVAEPIIKYNLKPSHQTAQKHQASALATSQQPNLQQQTVPSTQTPNDGHKHISPLLNSFKDKQVQVITQDQLKKLLKNKQPSLQNPTTAPFTTSLFANQHESSKTIPSNLKNPQFQIIDREQLESILKNRKRSQHPTLSGSGQDTNNPKLFNPSPLLTISNQKDLLGLVNKPALVSPKETGLKQISNPSEPMTIPGHSTTIRKASPDEVAALFGNFGLPTSVNSKSVSSFQGFNQNPTTILPTNNKQVDLKENELASLVQTLNSQNRQQSKPTLLPVESSNVPSQQNSQFISNKNKISTTKIQEQKQSAFPKNNEPFISPSQPIVLTDILNVNSRDSQNNIAVPSTTPFPTAKQQNENNDIVNKHVDNFVPSDYLATPANVQSQQVRGITQDELSQLLTSQKHVRLINPKDVPHLLGDANQEIRAIPIDELQQLLPKHRNRISVHKTAPAKREVSSVSVQEPSQSTTLAFGDRIPPPPSPYRYRTAFDAKTNGGQIPLGTSRRIDDTGVNSLEDVRNMQTVHDIRRFEEPENMHYSQAQERSFDIGGEDYEDYYSYDPPADQQFGEQVHTVVTLIPEKVFDEEAFKDSTGR